MPAASDLVGLWDIVSWEQAYDDGRIQFPMGEALEGFIRYGEDGDMTCLIARADRSKFVSGGQWNASESEMAQAYRSMLAYAGRYDVADDVVTHYVELSLFPNWKGGQQKRRLEVCEDGTIVLEARLEEGTPEARTARLIWRRHSGGVTDK